TAPVTALRAMPGAPQKNRSSGGYVSARLPGRQSCIAEFAATSGRYPDKGGVSTMFSVGEIEM
ncbi:hypothetical protein, partial [Pseudomonas helleri]|uniref:hypothetical protein n=1 Tax=Pseudomonas helleri TaxID=1608996 RepID=UPI003F9E797C